MANKKRHHEVKNESKIPPPINYNYLDDNDESSTQTPPLNTFLSDVELKQFLLDGYLIIKPSELNINPQWHSDFYQYCSQFWKEEGNPGNNVLARLPQLNEIFQDEKVKGVLTRVLGSDYVMQSHRYMHFTEPGTLDQKWHKDSYFGHGRPLRSNQLRNVMLMYYPQKTTIPMGPTALRKGTQYTCIDPKRYQGDLPNEFQNKSWRQDCDLFMECEAGSILLIHYDIIHRGSCNELRDRAMFKFQFSRVVEPQFDLNIVGNPNQLTEFDKVNEEDIKKYEENPQYPIAKHIWNWMHQIPFSQPITPFKLTEESLDEKQEQLRMGNNYRFALNGQYNILLKRMDSEHDQFSLNAAQAMVACRLPSAVKAVAAKIMAAKFNHVNGLIGCMYVISEWGPLVAESLEEDTLNNFIDYICSTKAKFTTITKIYVAEALGTIFCNHPINNPDNEPFNRALEKLCTNMTSSNCDDQTRYVSAFSIIRMGPSAEKATKTLNRVIKTDKCRYVIGFALDALERIGTRQAMKILMEYLKATRWCFLTTKDSQF